MMDDDWRKIHEKYKDADFAAAVPRSTFYWDVGILVGTIMKLLQRIDHYEREHNLPDDCCLRSDDEERPTT